MSRVKTSLDHKRIRRLIWLVLSVFVLLSYSLQSGAGSTHYSMVKQPYATVTSPPVFLNEGTAGYSTVYTNNTSAKIHIVAHIGLEEDYDYVLKLNNTVTDSWQILSLIHISEPTRPY